MTTKIYRVIVRFLKMRAVIVYLIASSRPPARVYVYFVDVAKLNVRVWDFKVLMAGID